MPSRVRQQVMQCWCMRAIATWNDVALVNWQHPEVGWRRVAGQIALWSMKHSRYSIQTMNYKVYTRRSTSFHRFDFENEIEARGENCESRRRSKGQKTFLPDLGKRVTGYSIEFRICKPSGKRHNRIAPLSCFTARIVEPRNGIASSEHHLWEHEHHRTLLVHISERPECIEKAISLPPMWILPSG